MSGIICLPFLLTLTSLLLLFGHSQVLASLNNNTDRLSLLSFKSQITLDPFGVLQTWNISTPFCKWEGVICNNIKQRVTSLNLGNLGIKGTISPHITNLSFLSDLNLQNNTLHGIIPKEIGKLFRLKSLEMSTNLLQGTIPSSLSLCSKLIVLDLSDNKLEGKIPPELGSLLKLEDFGLAGNFLIGEIPLSFGNLSSLVNLVLLTNELHGSIPERLGYLPFFINLQIGGNKFSGEIPKSLLNSSSLIVLGLALNFFSGHLPLDMFNKVTSLTTLYLGGNQFSGPIPISLINASQLVRIDLSVNKFMGVVPMLRNLPNIEVLDLDTNELANEGKMEFFHSLSNSTKLEVFSMASNRLTGELPSSIGNLSRKLSLFEMDDNYFQGNLPNEIGNMVGLTLLSLEFNLLRGNIPPSIGNLPNLQNIYMHNNNFSGEIPKSLGNLTLLSELHLQYNLLKGTIPSSLGKYQHVQILDLSHNKLSGEIPIEILNSPSFGKLLDLSWNDLSGLIPQEIGKLKMIQGIDFSSNNLEGEIPLSIGDCSNLLYLNLSQNGFQNSIPKTLVNLKGVEKIDFSSNNLTGEIPKSLESLQFLQVLDLSKNQLEGKVPEKGIFKNVTAVSLEGNRNLCGGNGQLKLPNCSIKISRKHTRNSKLKGIVGLVIGLGAVSTLVLVLLLFLRRRKVKNPAVDDIVDVGVHRLYSHSELRIATQNFNEENLIGEGSFGKVYKGVLSDGKIAAIKVFKLGQYKASKTFIAECEALRSIRHRNLVKTISVCSTGVFKALVLQYMPNGSLEKWLHEKIDEEELIFCMKKRFEIAQDIALAIEYLHHDCETPIVHCDIKPSNVLLDEDMCAHVSDFGLARVLFNNPNNQLVSSTIGLKGSIGYIPPGSALSQEVIKTCDKSSLRIIFFHGGTLLADFYQIEYGIGGEVSIKGDVYSFGILLFELFTNKRPTDKLFPENMDLRRWVSMSLPYHVADVVYLKLQGKEWNSNSSDCIVEVLEIGLKCTSCTPDIRPSMREVSAMIKGVRTKFLN